MTDDGKTIVIEILKRIQADIADLRGGMAHIRSEMTSEFAAVGARLVSVESRLGSVEDALRRQRRDIAGLLVIARSAAGDLALQIEAVERRTAVLEGAG